MQRDPIDNMADGTFFTKEADLQLYLDGIYRYYVYGHGIGGTNNTSHDKGFLAVRAGSQIIFGDAFSDNTVYAGGIDSKLGGTYDTPNAASKNFDAPWQWEKLRKVNYFLNHYAEVGDPETLKNTLRKLISSKHGIITSSWWLWVKYLGWKRNWIQVHRNFTALVCHVRSWLRKSWNVSTLPFRIWRTMITLVAISIKTWLYS